MYLLGWVWLDDAPFCGYHAGYVLKATLRQPGYKACTWETGAPHGKDDYARGFEVAPRDGHALYRASTYEDAANLPPGFGLYGRVRPAGDIEANQQIATLQQQLAVAAQQQPAPTPSTPVSPEQIAQAADVAFSEAFMAALGRVRI